MIYKYDIHEFISYGAIHKDVRTLGGGGGQPNVARPGQGGRGAWGSQEFPNLCGHTLWMIP